MILKKTLQAFIILFLMELAVMIVIGTWIGALPTIVLVLLGASIGLLLIQKFGYKTFYTAREEWSSGQPPGHTILKGVLLSLGAVLLIFPGFISDVIGILLLIPFTRRVIQRIIFEWLKKRTMRRFR
ncbi:FxsA family protein [Shimazuella kribbensis]|uniref:FxsA family protein n=1 Tax=Shimazuella kribbensis TaxID=139808 RepID=UPI000425B363|nr:FxsA family protein [Shimazuella kribbensis]